MGQTEIDTEAFCIVAKQITNKYMRLFNTVYFAQFNLNFNNEF